TSGVGGTAAPEGPRPQADVVGPAWSEDRRRGMVSPSEALAKRGETVRRESQRLLVPSQPGNRHRRDPGEGRGRRSTESLEGNMAGASHPAPVSPQLQRIAERQ